MTRFDQPFSRRQFLQTTAGLLAGAWGGSLLGLVACPDAAAAAGYPVVIDGEDFTAVHRVRDGEEFPIPVPSRAVDVVIVGGGICGLTAAYHLRDLDILVLEKEVKPGGHARRNRWQGIYYSEGTSYFSQPDEELAAFYRELAVPMKPIPAPTDRFLVGGRDFSEIWEREGRNLPYSDRVRRQFLKFKRAIETLSPMPMLPVDKTDPATLKLDRLSFAEWARPYGPELLALLDLFCRSAMGGSAREVSAYWGINFYSSEFTPALTLPGGTAGMAEILAARVQAAGRERILTGAAVIRIEAKGDKRVHVTYVRRGQTTTVAARAAIVAVPKNYARRVVQNLPQEQFEAMGQLRYQPYLVINLLLRGTPYRKSFDTWVAGTHFTDFIVADWIQGPVRRPHSILTVMTPVPIPERYLLLQDHLLKARVVQIVGQMEKTVPGLREKILEVRAFRWGHPMVLAAVGGLTRLQPRISRPFGPILFAHSDSQIAPAIESALWEGQKNAERARQLAAKGKAQAFFA